MARKSQVQVVEESERVLRDALHHIRNGWMTEMELRITNGVKIHGFSQNKIEEIRKLVRKGEATVKVCTWGGFKLSQVMNKPKNRLSLLDRADIKIISEEDPYHVAVFYLAFSIQPDNPDLSAAARYWDYERSSYRLGVGLWDCISTITNWNDDFEHRTAEKALKTIERRFAVAIAMCQIVREGLVA